MDMGIRNQGGKNLRETHARKVKNPGFAVEAVAPGTAAHIAATSSEGPPIKVVPVSIAESAALPVRTVIFLPSTVTATRRSSSK